MFSNNIDSTHTLKCFQTSLIVLTNFNVFKHNFCYERVFVYGNEQKCFSYLCTCNIKTTVATTSQKFDLLVSKWTGLKSDVPPRPCVYVSLVSTFYSTRPIIPCYLGLVCYTSMFKVYILTNLLVKKINLTSSKTEYTVYGQNLEKTKRIFFLNC